MENSTPLSVGNNYGIEYFAHRYHKTEVSILSQ